MQAIVRTGGKQYHVANGDVIRVEKLEGKAGDVIVLEDVLAIIDGKGSKLAADAASAKVAAEIVAQDRNDKVIVFKKKRRQNYRRKNGHRQHQTILRISDIAADGKVSTAKVAPAKKAEPKPEAKKEAKTEAKPATSAKKPAAADKPAAKKPAATKAKADSKK